MGNNECNQLRMEALRGPFYSRPLRSLREADDLSWMYPRTAQELLAYAGRVRNNLAKGQCTMDLIVKMAWVTVIDAHQVMFKRLVEIAAIKFFQHCLWTKAVVRDRPKYLLEGFQDLQEELVDPYLIPNERGVVGLPIHEAATYMGGVCSQANCRAKGWALNFCGACGNGTRIVGISRPTAEQCSAYLEAHQSLVLV